MPTYLLIGIALAAIPAALLLLRRHRADVLRKRIAVAIAAQLKYEAAHGVRQQKRVKVDRRLTPRPHHGHYDIDQREQSVLLKVRAAYRAARQKEPRGLVEAVREALR